MKQLHIGRFIAAAAAVFVAYFALEFLIHAALMKPVFEPMMKHLQGWRTEEQMYQPRYFASMVAGYVVYSLLFVWIYHWGWSGKCLEGLRYGLYAWLFTMVPWIFWWYSFQPVGAMVPWWFGISFVEMLVLGLIVGAIYKPKTDVG